MGKKGSFIKSLFLISHMQYCDFAVQFDPDKDSQADIADRIIYSLFISRIKANKPVITFIGGDSGEGKSITTLALFMIIMRLQGINIREFFSDINIYNPLEYPQKIKALLFDKRLKKVNMCAIHEARDLIRAKLWYNFLAQAVSDINAMSRSVKRLMIFIISQFIRDITTDIRYTLTYYCKVSRPKGRKARLYIYKMWKDDRDLEKPKLRKKRLFGYLILPNGRWRRFSPEYLEIEMPPKDLVKQFEKEDLASKEAALKSKMEKLQREMRQEVDTGHARIKLMVEHYIKNLDQLSTIGKRVKGKWRLSVNFREMHDITKEEGDIFQKELNKRLEETGVVDVEE